MTITIQAMAADGDGSVARVEFYDGSTFLDADTMAPYSASLGAATRGTHTLTAVAVDDRGGSTTSTAVTITVGAGQPTFYFVEADHLGTPRVVSNAAGTDVWAWEFGEPFGDTPANDDVDGDGLRLEFNPRFPGQYFDAETGLHQNRHREFQPELGRYVESDPIGWAALEPSTFQYASASPLRHTDVDGLRVDVILTKSWEPGVRGAMEHNSSPDVLTVHGHGALPNNKGIPEGTPLDTRSGQAVPLSPQALADIIRSHPKFMRKMDVRLFICRAGRNKQYIQELSDLLGSNVYAYEGDVYSLPTGYFSFGRAKKTSSCNCK